MGEPAEGRRRRMSTDARRKQIIDATVEVIRAKPLADVESRDISHAAGISRALLYHYFDSKSELFARALQQIYAQFKPLVTEESLDDLVPGLLDFAERYPEVCKSGAATFPQAALPELRVLFLRAHDEIVLGIARRLGHQDPDAKTRLVIRGWVGLASAVCTNWLEDERFSRKDAERALTDSMHILHGLEQAPAPGRPKPRKRSAQA